jgi:hypothetical protein
MKIAKIIAAGSFAAGLASLASASVVDIYVSGSTAYRSQVVTAEEAVAAVGLTTGNGYAPGAVIATADNGSSGVTSDGISSIRGADAAGNAIVFHNHFTGSVAGLCDLGNANTSLTFISDASTPAIGSANTVNVATDTTNYPEVSMADCAYTDAVQVLSGANTAGKTAAKNITSAAPYDAGTLNGGPGGYVGSVDFEWVVGSISGPALHGSLTNITQDQAEALLSSGQLCAAYATGNANDATSALIMVGRNEDSGTRVLTQGEGWANGTGNNHGVGAPMIQWMATQSGVALPTSSSYTSLSAVNAGITAIQPWPQYNTSTTVGWSLYTESTITWSTAGHSGYNGGGDVAAILESPNPVTSLGGLSNLGSEDYDFNGSSFTGAYLVTCIGTHDGAGVLTNTHGANGTLLTYNGVAYSKANIEAGIYPCWNFEHCYYIKSGSNVNALSNVTNGSIIKTDADALADGLFNGTFGTSSTDVGIAGNIIYNNYPAMFSRGQTAGSYLQ